MKQKLIELLKAVPEIKKDLEELRFGCEIQTDGGIDIILGNSYSNFIFNTENGLELSKGEIEIIGNPLEERHLRMYCESKKEDLWIYTDGSITSKGVLIVKLDNTKSFNDQTEEVYGSIVEFLESN